MEVSNSLAQFSLLSRASLKAPMMGVDSSDILTPTTNAVITTCHPYFRDRSTRPDCVPATSFEARLRLPISAYSVSSHHLEQETILPLPLFTLLASCRKSKMDVCDIRDFADCEISAEMFPLVLVPGCFISEYDLQKRKFSPLLLSTVCEARIQLKIDACADLSITSGCHSFPRSSTGLHSSSNAIQTNRVC